MPRLNEKHKFSCFALGNLEEGRPNLGNLTSVKAYRMMQYSMRSVLEERYGRETTKEIFYAAGELAGKEVCNNWLDINLPLEEFIASLCQVLEELRIGILKIEKTDMENLHFVMTVSEDLDCSGLPVYDFTVCDYDEGFIAGILKSYTKKNFKVKEIDCWCTGGRVCRFIAKAE